MLPDPTLLSAASSAAPELDPKTLVAVASTASDPADAIGRAQAIAGYSHVAMLADHISQLHPDDQAQLWSMKTPKEQKQLRAAGYKPPGGGGFSFGGLLSDVGHGIVGAAKTLGSGLNQHLVKPIEQVPGALLGTVAEPIHAIQHAYRSGHVLGEESAMQSNPNAGQAGVFSVAEATDFLHSFDGIFSPTAWARAWRQTTNGESTFEPSVMRKLNATVDPSTLRLAVQVASGEDEKSIISGYPQAQRQQIVSTIHTDPEFQKVVTQLSASKISLGRSVVGEKYLVDHGHYDPTTHQFHDPISGSIDAAFDWAADPTMHIGAAVKEIQAAKWGLNAQDVMAHLAADGTSMEEVLNPEAFQAGMHRVLQMTPAQRMVQQAGDLLARGQGSRLETLFPKSLGRVWPTLVQDGIDSPEKLNDWMASQAGMRAMLTGKAARISRGTVIVPHLSQVGWAKATAKGALQDTIENLADRSPSTEQGLLASAFRGKAQGAARFVRRLTTLVPTKPFLNLDDPQDAFELRRALGYAMPAKQADQIVQMWAATKDIGKRFDIARGAIAQMMHMAGAYTTPEGAKAADNVLAAMDEEFKNGVYSIGGIDKGADGTGSALLETQLNSRVHLPPLGEVLKAARADRTLKLLGIPVPHGLTSLATTIGGGAERFMNIWRPMILLRGGFPFRVANDENLENVLRKGLLGNLVVRGMSSAASNVERTVTRLTEDVPSGSKVWKGVYHAIGQKDYQGLSPWAKAIQTIGWHVDPQVLGHVRSARELAGAIFGEATYKAFGKASGLTREDYYNAAMHIHDKWDAVGPQISAMHHGAMGFDDLSKIVNHVVDGKVVPARMVEKGAYSEATVGDPQWRLKWHYALGQIGGSKLGRAVLKSIGNDPRTQVKRVLEVLNDPEFAYEKNRALRNWKLPDGRIVGVDATQADADQAWAKKVVAHVNALVRSSNPKNGNVLSDVVKEMLDAEDAPSMETLNKVAQHELPAGVFGPDLVPVQNVQKALATGMNHMAHAIDWLARQPNFTFAFAKARKELEPFARAFAGDNYQDLLNDLAWERAGNDLKPFIHSPELKTQFETMHRVAAPFLFAQRQFLQRWGRVFTQHPEAIRKLQLSMAGLRQLGVVHKDSQGQDAFTYPGTAAAVGLVAETLQHFGVQSAIPISEPFTGEVRYVMPGLSDPVTPSFGPAVTLPLKSLGNFFPELQGLEQGVLGQGASEGFLGQIAPSTLTRFASAFQKMSPDELGTQYGSMMTKAIMDLEANGYGLSENASAGEKQLYLRRLTNWTRINMFARAVFGFTFPASPTLSFDPKNLSGRFSQLLNELPYNQAIQEFQKEHPDASAYTVFASHSSGGATLPATKAAGDWLHANEGFARDFPQAAGWFIPRTLGSGPYDPAVYREQILDGLRNQVAPRQFLDDVTMAPSLNVYYQAYDMVKNAEAANPAKKSMIRQVFDQWSQSFLSANPLLQDYLTGSTKTEQRQATIRQLNDAIADHRAPTTPQAQHVATMVGAYDLFSDAIAHYEGNYSSGASSAKKAMLTAFQDWATAFAQEHSDVSDLWTVLIRPQADAVEAGYAPAVLTNQTGG